MAGPKAVVPELEERRVHEPQGVIVRVPPKASLAPTAASTALPGVAKLALGKLLVAPIANTVFMSITFVH